MTHAEVEVSFIKQKQDVLIVLTILCIKICIIFQKVIANKSNITHIRIYVSENVEQIIVLLEGAPISGVL